MTGVQTCALPILPKVATFGDAGEGSYFEQLAQTHRVAGCAEPDAGALASLLYTSGTTGRSKGAMLTCGNLLANAAALASAWCIQDSDRLVHVLPLFHVHGLFLSLNAMFCSGASVRIHRRFDPAETVDSLATASVFMGVPTHYTRLLASSALTADAVDEIGRAHV